MEIELGCWTRPWWDFTLQEALRGIAAAGFPIVGIAPFDDGPVFSADSTEEEIARLKAAVESHGLLPQVVFGSPDLSRELEEAVRLFQREIERVQRLGLPYMVLLGTADEDQYEKWYSAVERCLDFAGERGVMLLLKPHGGLSALAGDPCARLSGSTIRTSACAMTQAISTTTPARRPSKTCPRSSSTSARCASRTR